MLSGCVLQILAHIKARTQLDTRLYQAGILLYRKVTRHTTDACCCCCRLLLLLLVVAVVVMVVTRYVLWSWCLLLIDVVVRGIAFLVVLIPLCRYWECFVVLALFVDVVVQLRFMQLLILLMSVGIIPKPEPTAQPRQAGLQKGGGDPGLGY